MAESNPVVAAGHELSDFPIRPVVLAGAAVWIIVATIFGFCLVLFRLFIAPTPAPPPIASFPPEPRIAVAPALEYRQMRSEEDQVLSSYGWVDRKAGKVRIPVERAIDLQLERGFRTRKEAANK
jgi:hypothetical protein